MGARGEVSVGAPSQDPDRPTVTIVLATRDRPSVIGEAVRSVQAQDRPDLHILVIDQSSTDETRRVLEPLAAEDPRLSIVPSETVGVAVARNLAVSIAKTDIVAFTDDDCTVEPGWIDALMAEFQDPRVVGVYGRIVPPEFPTRTGTEIAFKESPGRAVFAGRVPPWHVGHGASRALRRQAILDVGGFDPHLGPGGTFGACEDLDIAYRLVAAGGRLVYTGAAVTYHSSWSDWGARRRVEQRYGVGAGAAFMKYIRLGDPYGLRLLLRWIWELGVRRIGAGLLKWKSVKPMYLGYCELVYPCLGAIRSLGQPIDRTRGIYAERA